MLRIIKESTPNKQITDIRDNLVFQVPCPNTDRRGIDIRLENYVIDLVLYMSHKVEYLPLVLDFLFFLYPFIPHFPSLSYVFQGLHLDLPRVVPTQTVSVCILYPDFSVSNPSVSLKPWSLECRLEKFSG